MSQAELIQGLQQDTLCSSNLLSEVAAEGSLNHTRLEIVLVYENTDPKSYVARVLFGLNLEE